MNGQLNSFDMSCEQLRYNRRVSDAVDADSNIQELIFSFATRFEIVMSEQLACDAHKQDAWTYIPFSNRKFLKSLTCIASRHANFGNARVFNFLDVGCGFGIKSWLASQSECRLKHITGIDICQKYIDLAKTIQPNMDFRCIDAMDFGDYQDYNAILFYDPHRKDRKLLDHVCGRVSVGTYIIGHTFSQSWI